LASSSLCTASLVGCLVNGMRVLAGGVEQRNGALCRPPLLSCSEQETNPLALHTLT
jgi:hypothetical protein